MNADKVRLESMPLGGPETECRILRKDEEMLEGATQIGEESGTDLTEK